MQWQSCSAPKKPMALLRISQLALSINIYMAVDGDHMHPTYLRIAAANHLSMFLPAAGIDIDIDIDMHRQQAPSFAKSLGKGTRLMRPLAHTPVNKRRGITCRLHENMRDSYGGQTREIEKAFTANINITGSHTDDKLISPTRATPISCHYCCACRLHADGLPH
jgi:hypothetical protein